MGNVQHGIDEVDCCDSCHIGFTQEYFVLLLSAANKEARANHTTVATMTTNRFALSMGLKPKLYV